jgi:hypothetical protein
LASGAKRSQHHLLQRQVDVGVVEDDTGVLAAHFGLNRYPARHSGRRDAPSDAGGSGEGDGIHPLVVDQAVAEVRPADEQVEDTGGQTRAGERVREPHRQQRHRAGRLPHHGVAVDQGRGDLPGRDRDREVERGDDANDPDRFTRHQDLLTDPR